MGPSKKVDIFYFITLLFLLISSNANFMSASDIAWGVILVFMFIVAMSKKLVQSKDVKPLGVLSAVYLVFMTARYFINVNLINNFDLSYLLTDVIFLFKYLFFTFFYCVILKDKAAASIVKVITDLTVISFFLYALQLVGLGEYIYNYGKALNITPNNLIPGYVNFIIFSYTKVYHEYRNSGFVWEPGSFGCFLVLALMFHWFLNKFRSDKTAIILIVGIVTTFSTTVYLGFIILLFLLYRYKVPKIGPRFIFIMVAFISLFIFVPFLGNKIFDTYYEDMTDVTRLKSLAPFYKSINMSYVPLNRFGSMAYIYNTFGAELILGVSNKYDIILNRNLSVNISNGVFEFIAKFGLVGFIYLMYKYCKFCLAFVVKSEFVVYCFLVLFVLAFGEPILYLPLVLMFIFISSKQTGFDRNPGRRERESLYKNSVA